MTGSVTGGGRRPLRRFFLTRPTCTRAMVSRSTRRATVITPAATISQVIAPTKAREAACAQTTAAPRTSANVDTG